MSGLATDRPSRRAYRGFSLILILMASWTSLFMFNPRLLLNPSLSTQDKNTTLVVQQEATEKPLPGKKKKQSRQEECVYPRIVWSPSVSDATIPVYNPNPLLDASLDIQPSRSKKLFYMNETDDYIPVENEVPIFDESCVAYKAWQTAYYPNCNSLHSLDYSDMQLLGVGNARIVWKVGQEKVALKMTRMNHFSTIRKKYEAWRIDAMIAERLTSSPRVLNIYGHCGVTTLNQEGTIKRNWARVHKTAKQKWSLAVQLARAVEDVHSIDGGDNVTAVWQNLKPDNVLFVGNKLVITDFDESALPRWNAQEQKPCKFHLSNTKLRAFQPLEPGAESGHEMDIYSLGVMLLAILTETSPRIPAGGALPVFAKRRVPRDIVSKRIQSIAMECMALNPIERPTAQRVVHNLEKAIRGKTAKM